MRLTNARSKLAALAASVVLCLSLVAHLTPQEAAAAQVENEAAFQTAKLTAKYYRNSLLCHLPLTPSFFKFEEKMRGLAPIDYGRGEKDGNAEVDETVKKIGLESHCMIAQTFHSEYARTIEKYGD